MASSRSIYNLCRRYCSCQGSQNTWQVVLGTGRHPAGSVPGYASSVLYKPCCSTIVGPPIGRNETRVGTIARHSLRIGDFVETTLLQASDGWRSFSTERTAQRIPTEIRLRKTEKALEVDFGGQSFRYPAELLRVESLSADNLRVDVKGQKRVVSGRRHIGILSLELVGNYGLRIHFDDLHSSGIFTWDLLYELGSNKIQRIRSYIGLLKERGLSRDPVVRPSSKKVDSTP